MKKLPLSIAVITKNEEENLKKLLPIISKYALQIVIVDSFSTDKTKDIAKLYTNYFIENSWNGFIEQKNLALSYCIYDWILSLDADEIPDDNLWKSIREVIENNQTGAYYLKRFTFYLGKLMKYSWQPDLQLRFFHKSTNAKWVGDYVHEKLIVNSAPKKLKGKLIHYSFKNIEHHLSKTIEYAKLGALSLRRKSKKVYKYNLIINPIFAFLKMYFLNLGCLDGWRGFIASFSSLIGTFLKYSFYYEQSIND